MSLTSILLRSREYLLDSFNQDVLGEPLFKTTIMSGFINHDPILYVPLAAIVGTGGGVQLRTTKILDFLENL